jgi:hypothetical protein
MRPVYKKYWFRVFAEESTQRAEWTVQTPVGRTEVQCGTTFYVQPNPSPGLVCSNERSEKVLAPNTKGPRDVPRCAVLGLLKMPLHYRGGVRRIRAQPFSSGRWPSFCPRVWFTSLSGLKSSPSGDLGLQRRSRRARGRRAPRGARTCCPRPSGKAR